MTRMTRMKELKDEDSTIAVDVSHIDSRRNPRDACGTQALATVAWQDSSKK